VEKLFEDTILRNIIVKLLDFQKSNTRILSYTLATQYGIHKNPLILFFFGKKCRKKGCVIKNTATIFLEKWV